MHSNYLKNANGAIYSQLRIAIQHDEMLKVDHLFPRNKLTTTVVNYNALVVSKIGAIFTNHIWQ